MPVTGSQVAAKAREFVGTPFQHQGRRKGRALDCVGLPLCVGEELGLLDRNKVPFKGSDNQNYSSQPLDAFVHDEAKRRLAEKPVEQMQDGDVVILRIPTVPCHAAIACTTNGVRGMIHAYSGNGKCVEHVMDDKWRKRIAGVFSYPGVTNG